MIEAVEQAVTRIERIAEQTKSPAGADDNEAVSKVFADALAEIDETVQRTVDAATSWIGRQGATADVAPDAFAETIERVYRQQPAWVRWAAKGLRQQLLELLAASESRQQRTEDGLAATLEGLQLMQQRVRKLTDKCRVQRVDVLGKLFDPNQMNALEAVPLESVSQPSGRTANAQPTEPLRSGEVIEQLRPAYYWKDMLLRYAQVRIAR